MIEVAETGSVGGAAPFVSYAQNLEDVMLWRALGEAAGPEGFYIDVGAAEPTALSVTRAFYDRGWRGIDVEPLAAEAAVLAAARPGDVVVAAALGDAEGRRVFHRVVLEGQTGLSTFDPVAAARHAAAGAAVETVEVEVTTLAALCRAHVRGPVHFLKVDVEGAEAAVLAGADFQAVRPWVVVVEATDPLLESGSEAGWEPGLLAAGYGFVWFDGLNRFYLAEERAALARHFRVQPNVFDQYVVHDAAAHARIVSAEVLAQHRATAIEALREEVVRLAQAAAPEAAVPEVTASAPAAVAAVPMGWRRRAALWAYRLVRPVVRPVAWRVRGFLVGDIRRELFEMATRQDAMLARMPAAERPGVAGGALGGLGPALERMILTLALEAGRGEGAGPTGERVDGLSKAVGDR